jgi:hypothetical protein
VNTNLHRIPLKIGKLMFLQTLDLNGLFELKEMPVSIVQLRNLMFLYVEFEYPAYIPVDYKNLTSLEELVVPFSEDTDPEELGYLTELRVLYIFLPSSYPPRKLLILVESLGKLHKLQRIFINIRGGEKIDNLGDWVPSSPQLRSLVLKWWYETMPTWISTSLLPRVCRLSIRVHQVRLEDIQVLGTLPSLRSVSLLSDLDTATEEERAGERSFMLSTDAFPRATHCCFDNIIFAPNMIPPGAMPMVDDLSFGLLVSDILSGGDRELCISNLPSLKHVLINLYGEEESSERYSEAKAAVERAAADHPNHPEAFIR